MIDSLRAFGPSSLTFIITAGQQLVRRTAPQRQHAVRGHRHRLGTSWQVSDIELSTVGHHDEQAPDPDQEGNAAAARSSERPRILVLGIIGSWPSRLGLLAVPILIGTKRSSRRAPAARVSRRAGRAADRQRQGQVDPGQLPVLVQEGRQQYGVPWTILAASGRWKATTARPPCPACTAGRTPSARPADADRDRRRGHQRLGRAPVHPASQVVNGIAPTKTAARTRTSTTRRRDPGAAKYLPRSRCRPTPRRRSSPTTTCSRTCRACCLASQYAAATSPWCPR